jgi:hypothetical protein
MYPTLPDVAVKIETLEGITTELAEVEDRLVKAHGIPRRAFQRELARRICSGEVPLSRDVERWEMLYAALLDWASNGAELGSAVNAKPPDSTTNATEGAAAGGPFFMSPDPSGGPGRGRDANPFRVRLCAAPRLPRRLGGLMSWGEHSLDP